MILIPLKFELFAQVVLNDTSSLKSHSTSKMGHTDPPLTSTLIFTTTLLSLFPLSKKQNIMTEKSGEIGRLNELKAFVSSKTGVKGLVDTKITEVPRIFHVPSSTTISNNKPSDISSFNLTVPIIDLGDGNISSTRNVLVSKIKEAAENWGVFQVINHGIPLTILEEIKEGVRRFHEEDPEIKKQYFAKDFNKRFAYNTNFDIYHSSPMNWRDSFTCYTCVQDPLKPEEIPLACR